MGRKLSLLLAILATVVVAGNAIAADLYVLQVGDGAAALLTSSTAVFVQKFSDTGTSQTPSNTIALPTAVGVGGNQPLTMSGTANSEGFLSLTADNKYLMLGGYAVAPGTSAGATGIANSLSSAAPRVVGRIDLTPVTPEIDTTTVFTGDSSFSGSGTTTAGNPRSVASTNGTDIWVGGSASSTSNGGVRYTTLGSHTSTQLTSSPTNARVVTIQNTGTDQLYVSSASGSFFGPGTVGSGVPTTAGQTSTLLNGFPTSTGPSSYDYWFKDASTLYVADDRSVSTGGGIQRWNLTAGTWTLAYTIPVGSTAGTGSGGGAKGLAGVFDSIGGTTTLYATSNFSSANHLVSVVDTGAGSLFTSLADAPANTAFRGVELVSAVVPPTGVAGDYNNDNVVDAADYTVWRDHLGQTAPGYQLPHEDPNTSPGSVETDDYTYWANHFGATFPGSGAASLSSGAVPEPASMALIAIGLVGLVAGRRRFDR